MRPSKPPHLIQIAKLYGITPGGLIHLRERHAISAEVLGDPDLLFATLNNVSNNGKLRRNLQDPAKRREIKTAIQSLPKS